MAMRARAGATVFGLSVIALIALCGSAVAAERACSGTDEPIATDRPDVTNSSQVVPLGSFQNENGFDLTGHGSERTLAGSESRLRLGVASCFEVLVDLPTYTQPFGTSEVRGFSDVVPAVKYQLPQLPGDVTLSVTAGVGLPTGSTAATVPGMQPYLQFPWSKELGEGWGISGMFTEFFFPAVPANAFRTQATFVLEKQISPHADLFVEYVGDYPRLGGSSQLFNFGGAYRITPLQQIDFHVGIGLNRNAPDYIVGVGYSFRVDGLFGLRRE
jgi:hypothetical protein